MQYTHKGKIDIIYIDPPYNTGKKDFKYNDKWVDENDGYRHSKWLTFMSKRLKLAKSLVTKDGVFFISIDDNEYSHLKLLCDEVFNGHKNYIGTLVWEKKKKGSYLNNSITNIKEYILIYAKDINYFSGLIGETTEKRETYPCVNPGNSVGLRKFYKGTKSNFREKNYILKKGETISAGNMSLILHSDLVIKDGVLDKDVVLEGEWRYRQSEIDKYSAMNTIYLTNKLYFRRIVTEARDKMIKDLLPRIEYDKIIHIQNNLINEYEKSDIDEDEILRIKSELNSLLNQSYDDVNIYDLFSNGWGSNEDSDNEQRDFFGKKVFDYPKPSKLILKLLASTRKKDATILDFMAGTGTTGQATVELNKIDGGNRKFILATNNENNICEEITYTRLEKIKNGYNWKRKRKDGYTEPISFNLEYLKTELLKYDSNKHIDLDIKEFMVDKLTEIIKVRESCFELNTVTPFLSKFAHKEKSVYILHNIYNMNKSDYDEAISALNNDNNNNINIYILSISNHSHYMKKVSKANKNIVFEPLPENFLKMLRKLERKQI